MGETNSTRTRPGAIRARIIQVGAVAAAVIVLAAACGDTGGPTPASTSADTTLGFANAGSSATEIVTPDGEALAVTISAVPGAEVTVVLAHMRGANRATWDPIIGPLNDAGNTTLAFDFRGYGESTGERDTHLDTDLAAAVNRARADGASKIVIIGASMGGTAVLEGGARLSADGVVAISAPAEFLGLDGGAGAALLTVPTLLIDTTGDHPYVDQLTAIEAATGASIVTYDGSAHGTAILATHGTELTSLITEFVDRVAAIKTGY